MTTLIGVSLKMYFGHAQTVEWCRAVRRLAEEHPAVRDGEAELFVLPSFPAIPAAIQILAPLVAVGAQDIASHDSGAFTGEVSGAELAELGCGIAEIGHAERRLLGETEEQVSEKVAAAFRNGLTPLLCVGEEERDVDAAGICIDQIDSALRFAEDRGQLAPLIVAYEPVWAIGQAQPAPDSHVREMCQRLRDHLGTLPAVSSRVIYGGSAGPGLLTRVKDSVDGLFLGRFAHDPAAIRSILDEVHELRLS